MYLVVWAVGPCVQKGAILNKTNSECLKVLLSSITMVSLFVSAKNRQIEYNQSGCESLKSQGHDFCQCSAYVELSTRHK